MKKAVCLILIAVLISVSMCYSVSANTEDHITLSDLSDTECLAFLVEYNVQIPAEYENESDCLPFVRLIIGQIEKNPNAIFTFGAQFLNNFADEIAFAVRDYYGISSVSTFGLVTSSSNILVDNYVIGPYLDEYEDYNCYGFAIGIHRWAHPGQFKWEHNGNDWDTYYYNPYANIYTLAEWVRDDLLSLGYTVSMPTTTCPYTAITDHTHLICIRKDEDGGDFHLMALYDNDHWYHKPGATNKLRYNPVPSNDTVWVCEGFDGTVFFRNTDITYESTIYYIQYTTPHHWYYAPYGISTHIQTCYTCGETTGTATSCVYLNYYCKVCGRFNNITPTLPTNSITPQQDTAQNAE